MAEDHITLPDISQKTRKVAIRDRSVQIGDIIGVNAYRVNRTLLKQRFEEGGYRIRETHHFLLFTRKEAPSKILAHWLAPTEVDANVGDYFMQELKPLGLLEKPQDFSDIFGAVVCSLTPHDPQHAFRLYCTNSLCHYQHFLESSDYEHLPLE